MANVIELVTFKLKEGVTEEHFLTASDEVNTGALSLQKGFINRKLVKNEDIWVDIVLWETMDDAMNAAKAIVQSPISIPFGECIEQSTCQMQHLTVIKSY
jgi:aspartate/tyrosine/aromatic aminotransferase